MIRALLDGSKTQTRRAVKSGSGGRVRLPEQNADRIRRRARSVLHCDAADLAAAKAGTLAAFCPYGAPGDQLWCKETWRVQDAAEGEIRYGADGETRRFLSAGDAAFWKRWREKSHLKNGGPAW